MFCLNLGAFGRCIGITFVDSTIILVCHNLRRYANKVFKGIATDGKGTMGWCHGFKLHLACNDKGEIIAFVLTGANVSDKDPNVFKVLAKIIETINDMLKNTAQIVHSRHRSVSNEFAYLSSHAINRYFIPE